MARRPLEDRLSQKLKDSEFDFLGNNPIHINEVYSRVKELFPDFCDDEYLCSTHCKNGTNQPEWKHVVRSDMQLMKKKGIAMRTGNVREWIFLPRV